MNYFDWLYNRLYLDKLNGSRVGQSHMNNVRPKMQNSELFYCTGPEVWSMIDQIEKDYQTGPYGVNNNGNT